MANTKTKSNVKINETGDSDKNVKIEKETNAADKNTTKKEAPIIAKNIDPNQYITVRNGFQGTLVYKSGRTGERFVWDEFGAGQDIQLRDLQNAKSSHKKMFINNWFMFDEDWVIDYLGVGQYYKTSINIDDFDAIFTKTPEEIKTIIGGLSEGQKKSVSYRARQLICNGEIDSRKSVAALEDALCIELIEK